MTKRYPIRLLFSIVFLTILSVVCAQNSTLISPLTSFHSTPAYQTFALLSNTSPIYKAGISVGRLVVDFQESSGWKTQTTCTASLISESWIITASHCIAGGQRELSTQDGKSIKGNFLILGATLEMNYDGNSNVDRYFVNTKKPIEDIATLDYAILQVDAASDDTLPGKKYGYISLLNSKIANPSDNLFIIHHPGGSEKKLTYQDCRIISNDQIKNKYQGRLVGYTPLNFNQQTGMHRCDLEGGSSGSLLMQLINQKLFVIGINIAGTEAKDTQISDRANFFQKIPFIVEHSIALKKIAGILPKPTLDYSVRIIYAVASDKKIKDASVIGMKRAAQNLQTWYREQLKGKSFVLNDPIVETCGLSQKASYYQIDSYNRVFNDINSQCVAIKYYDSKYLWIVYADVDEICNKDNLGRAGSGVGIMGRMDIEGLSGKNSVTSACGETYNFEFSRYVGGLGQILGLALGLPHPPGCEEQKPTCDSNALMWGGMYIFPNTYLRSEEKIQLSASQFFR
jgi:hypothetical protein